MRKHLIFIIALILIPFGYANANQVFPGAEGYGTSWSIQDWPDQTPDVYRIDTLDYVRSGSDPSENADNGTWKDYDSSLFHALEVATGARIIIFEVSGYIDWADEASSQQVRIVNPYVIVAGQTAPSPGVTIKNAGLTIKTHHVLIQHIRSRTGDEAGSACCDNPSSCNTIQIQDLPNEDDTYNIVLDHLSLSWSVDKILGSYYGAYHWTLSNSILAEPLDTEDPPVGGCYKGSPNGNYIMLLDGATPSPISIIKNGLFDGRQRNPYFDDIGNKQKSIFVNNFVYDFGNIAANAHTDDGQAVDMEGNVYVQGGNSTQTSMLYLYGTGTATSSYWLSDNSFSEEPPAARSLPAGTQWDLVGGEDAEDTKAVARNHTFPTNLTVLANAAVEAYVRANAGAYMTYRGDIVSDVDSRMWANIDADDGSGNYPNTAPTYPTLTPDTRALTLPTNPYSDDDSDDYYNIEEWIHSFSANVEEDTFTISGAGPSGVQNCTSDPRAVTISWDTDRYSNCRIKTTDEGDYDDMPADSVTNTNRQDHSVAPSLACDASYTYYVYCEDPAGNEVGETTITFTIEPGEPHHPYPDEGSATMSGGGGSGGSM